MWNWYSGDDSQSSGASAANQSAGAMSVADLTEQLAHTQQLVAQLKDLIREKDNELRKKDQDLKVQLESLPLLPVSVIAYGSDVTSTALQPITELINLGRTAELTEVTSALQTVAATRSSGRDPKMDLGREEKESSESKISKAKLQNKAKIASMTAQLEELKKQLPSAGAQVKKSESRKGSGDADQENASANRGKILVLRKRVEELESQLTLKNGELKKKEELLEAQRLRGSELDVMLAEKEEKLAKKEAYIKDLQMATASKAPAEATSAEPEAKMTANDSAQDLQVLIQNLTRKVEESEEKYSLLHEQTESLKAFLNKEKSHFQEKEAMYTENIRVYQNIILEKDKEMKLLSEKHDQELFKIAAKSDSSAELHQLLKALKQKLHEDEEVLSGKNQVIDVLQKELDNKDRQISEMSETCRFLQSEKQNLQSKLDAEKHVMRAQLKDMMEKHETEMQALSVRHSSALQEIKEKHEGELQEKGQTIRQLQNQLQGLASPGEVRDGTGATPNSAVTKLQDEVKLKTEEASRSDAKFLKMKAWSKSRIRQLEEELKISEAKNQELTALAVRIGELEEEKEALEGKLESVADLQSINEHLLTKLVVYEEQQRILQADLEQVAKRADSQTSESGSADDLQNPLLEWSPETDIATDQEREDSSVMVFRMAQIEEEREEGYRVSSHTCSPTIRTMSTACTATPYPHRSLSRTKILAQKRAQKSGPGSVPRPLAYQSLSVGGDEDVHHSSVTSHSPQVSNGVGCLVTYFACSSCNSKLPSGQSSPLCQSCSNPIVPTAQDPPAVPPESDPPIPGWAASLSQSVADLTRVSQTLVSALDRLPLQTPAVASGSQEPPPEPSLISHKRSRQERRSESSSRSISPLGPPPRLVSHRSSSPESGEALSDAPSEDTSELDPHQIATMSETVQNLIGAINQTCGIKDPSTEPADQAVSFRRAKPPSKFFAPHPEFEEIVSRERENPTRRFQRGKRLGVLYPFPPELTANWTASPSVDPPVSRLSTNTVLPLSGGASLKDSNDRVIESFAKSAFEAASAALCPAFASTWASKSISKWAKDLRRGILDGAPPAQLAELANQISHAGEYLVSASLDAASCAAQASSNAVAIRRTVWLKAWQADLSSKKSLTSLPFQGSRLFGSQLDQIIKDATGGTSSPLPQAKPRRPPPRRQFRSFRPFRRFAASNSLSQQQQRPQARQEKKAVSFRPTPSWRPRFSQGPGLEDPPRHDSRQDSSPTPRLGGRLLLFRDVWISAVEDAWVREVVSSGYKIEFASQPRDRFFQSRPPRDPALVPGFFSAIASLLKSGVIVPVPEKERFTGFYSNLFVVPKKDGKVRPILDLKLLNRRVRLRHFRMESLRSVIASMEAQEFLCSIDIQDTYLHVPIFPGHHRFLRFAVQRDHFQFVALPFGLATAPRVFTKIMAALMAILRVRGLVLFPYLDDILIKAPSFAQAHESLSIVLDTLARFGWLVNRKKSCLIPSQRIIFLGMLFDTRQSRVFLPTDKRSTLCQDIRLLQGPRPPSLRSAMKVLGRMVATLEAIPFAQLHSRPLQQAILSQWDRSVFSLDRQIKLSFRVRRSLNWWLTSPLISQGRSFLPVHWQVVTTDASLLGWDAVFSPPDGPGPLVAAGVFSADQRPRNSGHLPVPPPLGKDSQGPSSPDPDGQRHGCGICQPSGGDSELLGPCRGIQDPPLGRGNGSGDIRGAYPRRGKLGRRLPQPRGPRGRGMVLTSGGLPSDLSSRWGTPDVDLTASRVNRKVPQFVSRSRDPLAVGVDALAIPWSQFELPYLFPPLPLLPKLLKKIKAEGVPVILIAPDWPRRAWFAELVNLLADAPWRLPDRPDLLSQGPICHPNSRSLSLTAWLLRPRF
ncbi:unnamed protein product [Ranitomeya imitator]|uniref:ribonuclease H n=1 Tax=Ranitomeya imitator TaxID=111125 RepID=A0ABN9L118_9NEOB|nr:unnamed protein product [Ranitomeya imitator]